MTTHDSADDELAAARARCAQLERDLAIAHTRFDLVLEATNDGVWDWDLRTNEVFFSRRWKAILGYEEHEFENVATRFFESLHPEDKPRVEAAVYRHLEGKGSYDVEFRIKTKTGEYRVIRARGQAQWSEQGTPLRMAGTHTDVTDERERERERERDRQLIASQRATIDALGTPLLELGDGVLCLPIIGPLGRDRAATMTSATLDRVTRGATRVVIDLTAAEIKGASTAQHLTQMFRAVMLIGARCAVCGIQPVFARALVDQGISIDEFPVFRTLGDALRSVHEL